MTPSPPHHIIGLDLGQAHDFSAWIVTQRIDRENLPPLYDVAHIDRTRGAKYPAVVEHTRLLVDSLKTADPLARVDLVVDFTGVGRAVGDMIVDANLQLSTSPTLVTITGGDMVTRGDAGELRVPKRDLAGAIQVVLQSERLRIAERLPLARTLTDELVGFKVKISLTGHDSYAAGEDWRSAPHDDLVLALALAVWQGERAMAGPLMS